MFFTFIKMQHLADNTFVEVNLNDAKKEKNISSTITIEFLKSLLRLLILHEMGMYS